MSAYTGVVTENNTVVTGNSGIVDANGTIWSISDGGQVISAAYNGQGGNDPFVTDKLTDHVIALAYAGGKVWQENTSLLWYSKVGNVPGSYDGWSPGTRTTPVPASPSSSIIMEVTAPFSADGTPVLSRNPAGAGSTLVDSQGTLWGVANGQVIKNGAVDKLTDHVIAVTYVNGAIWQENTSLLWYKQIGNAAGNYDGWASGTPIAPIPIWRSWIGGGNNLASNPADWRPGMAPGTGDALSMNGGTMNIVGNALHGSTIYGASTGNTIVNTLSVSGNASFNDNGQSVVNLAAGANWTGSIGIGPYTGGVVVNGSATFTNVASSINNTVSIDAIVAGTGTFNVSAVHNQGRLEFQHGVSAGQTVTIYGNQYGPVGATVIADDPKSYLATTNLGAGDLILKGLVADSYSFKNDLLTLMKDNTIVDTLHLTKMTGPYGVTNFGVSQLSAAIDIHGGNYQETGTLLPLH